MCLLQACPKSMYKFGATNFIFFTLQALGTSFNLDCMGTDPGLLLAINTFQSVSILEKYSDTHSKSNTQTHT